MFQEGNHILNPNVQLYLKIFPHAVIEIQTQRHHANIEASFSVSRGKPCDILDLDV